MKKLISIVDFVLTNKYTETGHKRYALFLSQKLELWMFIPCKLVDGVWVVLEEPKEEMEKYRMIVGEEKEDVLDLHSFDLDFKEYQEAKDRVLFEGFYLKYLDKFVSTVSNQKLWFNFKSRNIFVNDKVVSIIQDLVKYNLQLTPTAQKQLFP